MASTRRYLSHSPADLARPLATRRRGDTRAVLSIDIDSTPRECSSYCSFLDALCSPLFSSVRAETPTVLPYFYRGWLTSVLACIDNGILCLLPGEKRAWTQLVVVALSQSCAGGKKRWYASVLELQLTSLEFCRVCRRARLLQVNVESASPRNLVAP